MDINKVIVMNGIEEVVDNNEYLMYLNQNHKQIPIEVKEEL